MKQRDAIARALAYPSGGLRARFDFMNRGQRHQRGGDRDRTRTDGRRGHLVMGTVWGAHLNLGVTLAFALRGDFPWKRVPGYLFAQFAGARPATSVLVLGR